MWGPWCPAWATDPTSPGFNGKPFTRTRLKFRLQTQRECTAGTVASQYATSGYYPRQYCAQHVAAAGVYKVYLTDFTYHAATQIGPAEGKFLSQDGEKFFLAV